VRRVPLHPFLFAAFPALALWSANRSEVFADEVVVPVAVSLALAVCAWVLLGSLAGGVDRGAVLASAAVLALFTFGHARHAAMSLDVGSPFLRHDLFNLLWLQLYLVVAFFVLRTRGDVRRLHRPLTLAAAFLVLAPLASVGAHELTHGDAWSAAATDGGVVAATSPRPDIYVVVLDGYAGGATLAGSYGFDNEPFLRGLESRGFDVARQSRSNYALTFLSLASTLNYRYLDLEEGAEAQDAYMMIKENDAARFLRERGYHVVYFRSGWGPTQHVDADWLVDCGRTTEYQRALLATTPLLLVDGGFAGETRDRVLCQFDVLARMPRADGPLFVVAHLVTPHPPYVFAADGAPLAQAVPDAGEGPGLAGDRLAAAKAAYLGQLRFVNGKVLDAVDGIVAQDPDAVVVLLSDHGPGQGGNWSDPDARFLRERFRNLLAVRLPGADGDVLADDATNVDSLRVVLSRVHGADLPPLPGRSWFASYERPWDLDEVTDVVAP